ncbi:Transcriptional regulator, contains Arc/MetJ-type RHH (ribbon-helix-helix) DNA-binding domain [Sphingomonas guangdongensis]|uniref:Transcriptional regulator, contains Arc/MetJ-type RHH (Ribbon-helix-helix) DNA-binding domain n=2 Tax=Sphingomonas guangdongensis TaxID=1141890 RepID=A0A285QDB2_9SPHN|nr:Transcriptional regulator, contains Arc/MetJ-type RHH (ribbon-helix-helix) DNA-binding domain [Sphingomonas guangdongensis]
MRNVAESEKITINLGFVDLGHVDLLVREGFYGNRTDFIRTAIRNQLERHSNEAKQSVSRRALQLGVCHLSAQELGSAREADEKLDIRVLGLLSIGSDVTPELALATIRSITILGALHATPAIKAALADRIT